MHNPTQESAMTEVALALAMGFFSIMVLTLISMGVDRKAETPHQAVALVPADSPSEARGANAPRPDDFVVIYDGNGFLDRDLVPIDPQTLAGQALPDGQRIILAIDPALPLSQAMEARSQIETTNLVVSILDRSWLEALSRARGGRQ